MIKTCQKPPVYFESTTGSFYSQYAGLPLKSCRVDLPVNQSGSGTPSPTNIRNFIGYNKLTFSNIGDSDIKNYLTGVINGTYGFVDLGSLNYNYTASSSIFSSSINNMASPDSASGRKKGILSSKYPPSSVTTINQNMDDKSMLRNNGEIYIRDTSYNDASDFKTAMSDVYLIYELETPTAPSYTKEQFDALCNSFNVSGISATFTFGQNVYVGYLNILTGELVATHKLKTIDENSDVNMSSTGTGIFYLNDFFEIDEDTESVNSNLYQRAGNRSSTTGVINYNPDYSFCCKLDSYPTRILIKDTRFTSTEDYKTWLQDNPVDIAVKLATPITIPLGGMEINTILGLNSLSSSVGNISAEYIKAGR